MKKNMFNNSRAFGASQEWKWKREKEWIFSSFAKASRAKCIWGPKFAFLLKSSFIGIFVALSFADVVKKGFHFELRCLQTGAQHKMLNTVMKLIKNGLVRNEKAFKNALLKVICFCSFNQPISTG